jgi:hypothetical protein
VKIESGKVTVIRISDIMASHRLDPIRVTIDDIEPGKGRITIECYGKAWASYWGAMGDKTIAQFVASCDNQYLIQNLTENLRGTRFSGEALARFARKTVCLRRRWRYRNTRINYDDLSREYARELFNDTDDLASCESHDSCWTKSDLLTKIFGEEWFLSVGSEFEEINPEYAYLERICTAVREALVELANPQAPDTSKGITWQTLQFA